MPASFPGLFPFPVHPIQKIKALGTRLVSCVRKNGILELITGEVLCNVVVERNDCRLGKETVWQSSPESVLGSLCSGADFLFAEASIVHALLVSCCISVWVFCFKSFGDCNKKHSVFHPACQSLFLLPNLIVWEVTSYIVNLSPSSMTDIIFQILTCFYFGNSQVFFSMKDVYYPTSLSRV